ncbi:MAG: TRAP transporter substrate-binding protein [Oscillospiraceae bacterium]|nr:TRAP transporter substrate-binding protein [Oscillospiraceae bacterium]
MKRALTLVLAFMFVLALAAGCGGGNTNQPASGDTTRAPAATNAPSSTGSAPAPQDNTVYTINASFIPSDTTPTVQSYHSFKASLEEKSNSRFLVNIYAGGSMGSSDADNTEKCAQNIVQMTDTPTHTLSEFTGIKEYAVTTVPFMFTTDREFYTFLDSDLMAQVGKDLTDRTGLRVYGGFFDGFMAVATINNSIRTPADIAGLKIRTQTSDAYINTVNELGASAIPMGAGEIYTSLQQGVIDGISGIPMMIVNEQYYTILGHLADVNAFVNNHMIIINNEFYQGLPADLQAVLDECLAELLSVVRKNVGDFVEECNKICADNGMEVIRLTPAERQVWIDACKETYTSMCANFGADFIASVEKLMGR